MSVALAFVVTQAVISQPLTSTDRDQTVGKIEEPERAVLAEKRKCPAIPRKAPAGNVMMVATPVLLPEPETELYTPGGDGCR